VLARRDRKRPHSVASLEFAEGEPEAAFAALASGRGAILSSLARASLRLQVGSEFTLQTAEGPQSYRVVGLASDVLTAKIPAVYISQASMAADFHKMEDILLLLNLRPGADQTAALADVQEIVNDYPQFTVHLTNEYREEMYRGIDNNMRLL